MALAQRNDILIVQVQTVLSALSASVIVLMLAQQSDI